MILFLIFNAALIHSQIITICSDATCSSGCKTYEAPICISDYTGNLYFNSKQIDFYNDTVCSILIINKTQPLFIDYKCHILNNAFYIAVARDNNTILFLLPIFFFIILGFIYRCAKETPKDDINNTPPIRD